MSIGNALQAAVNGYAQGRNIKHSWEDRKLDRERQARIDKLAEAQEQRAGEAHRMNMESSGIMNSARRQAIRQADQDWTDSQDVRGSLAAADEAALAGLSAPTAQPRQLVPAAVSTNGSAPLGATRDDAVTASRLPPPAVPAAPRRAAAPSEALGAVRDTAGNPATPPAGAGARPQNPAIVGGVVLPPPLNPDGSTTPATKQGYEYGRPGKMVDDIDQAGTALGRGIGDTLSRTGETVTNQAVDALQRINAPFQAASSYATGKDYIGAPSRVDMSGDGRTEAMGTPLADAIASVTSKPAPASAQASAAPKHAPAAAGSAATETAKVVSDSAAKAMDAVTQSPSMKAATDAIPAADLGATRNAPISKGQRERAAKSYMDSYRENGAPLVIRQLMRQGRLKEAQDFETWVNDSKTADGMKAWGRGIFAAMQGDGDGAADAFMDAYNNAGYFDDGYELVKSKSGLIKNDAGEVVGVTMVMKDLQTGEVFEQSDSIDGFIEKASWITSPEKAFEASQARMAAQQEALIKADEERRKAATGLIEAQYKAMAADPGARAVDLMEQSQLSENPLTYDQAAEIVMNERRARLMGQGGQSRAEVPPPVARRPN